MYYKECGGDGGEGRVLGVGLMCMCVCMCMDGLCGFVA